MERPKNDCTVVSLRFLFFALLLIFAAFLINVFRIIDISPSNYSTVISNTLFNQYFISPRIISNTLPTVQSTKPRVHVNHPSCFSRSHLPLLHDLDNVGNTAVPEVPPLLSQTWESYGQLHSRCTKNGSFPDKNCKYLLFSDEQLCGLGNRLGSLASAIMYAIATDRVLLLDNRRNLGDLLCEPFSHLHPSSSWLLPPDSTYHSLIKKAPTTAKYVNSKKADHDKLDEDGLVKVSLWDEPGDGDLEFFIEEVYQLVGKAKWVVWESDLYTIPNLFLVPSFWQRMRHLFVKKEDRAFALVSHLALLPSNDVWAMVLKEYSSYMLGATKRVGVQIRLHGRPDRAMYDEGAMDMIMKCLVERYYIPQLAILNSNQSSVGEMTSSYMERITEIKKEGQLVDVAILVASLQSQYFLKMKEVYSEGRGIEDGQLVRVHSVSGLKTQDFTLRQAQLALAEMWLLSFSHELAISASSTFGYASHAWGRLLPLILHFNDPSLHCYYGYSSDPCSHLPRVPLHFHLANLSPTHQHWITQHLRSCQDRPGAWQLVPPSVHSNIAAPIFSMPALRTALS